MYHYLDDKDFLRSMRSLSGDIMQLLCHNLKEDHDIGANFRLVGSGARNLILQNEGNPVDLDYNLEIVRCENYRDCRHLKECARKAFNKALNEHDLPDCEDSTSALTSKPIRFCSGKNTPFSIDVCITKRDETGNYYRLIHSKTGWTVNDQYFWNMAPQSKDLGKKADRIKACGKWKTVREQYLSNKNRYLTRHDYEHTSFVCYVEAVNTVYDHLNHW